MEPPPMPIWSNLCIHYGRNGILMFLFFPLGWHKYHVIFFHSRALVAKDAVNLTAGTRKLFPRSFRSPDYETHWWWRVQLTIRFQVKLCCESLNSVSAHSRFWSTRSYWHLADLFLGFTGRGFWWFLHLLQSRDVVPTWPEVHIGPTASIAGAAHYAQRTGQQRDTFGKVHYSSLKLDLGTPRPWMQGELKLSRIHLTKFAIVCLS